MSLVETVQKWRSSKNFWNILEHLLLPKVITGSIARDGGHPKALFQLDIFYLPCDTVLNTNIVFEIFSHKLSVKAHRGKLLVAISLNVTRPEIQFGRTLF